REEEVSSPTGRLHVLQWQCLRVQRLPSATDQVDVQPDLLVIGDVPDPGLREQPTRSGEGLLEDVYHLRTWHGAGARVLARLSARTRASDFVLTLLVGVALVLIGVSLKVAFSSVTRSVVRASYSRQQAKCRCLG